MVSLSSIVSKIKAVKLFIPPRFEKSPRFGLFVVEAMLRGSKGKLILNRGKIF